MYYSVQTHEKQSQRYHSDRAVAMPGTLIIFISDITKHDNIFMTQSYGVQIG